MELVKVNCLLFTSIQDDTYRGAKTRLTEFATNYIKDNNGYDMLLNVDSIVSVSEISYKTVAGKRIYGFYVLTNNNYKYWIINNENNYGPLESFIFKKDDKKTIIKPDEKLHLNKKR